MKREPFLIPRTDTSPPLFETSLFDALRQNPKSSIDGRFQGIPFNARIAIPDYGEHLLRRYGATAPRGLPSACEQAGIRFDLARFGLVIAFDDPAEIAIHGLDMVLDGTVRDLVERFGPVVFRNAHIAGEARNQFHRNIFPHLRFHTDRGPTAENQYSCFTRDPFDAEQRGRRASSTLFMANLAAWLEYVQNGGGDARAERGVRASYDLFEGTDMKALLGGVVFEQPWHEPDGTGEVVVADNRTVLHATYHKDGETKGYPIGARYLI